MWEELHWRFIEELKGELRKLKSMANRETMSLEDLKFYVLMSDENGVAPFRMPRTFDLNHPEGWFCTEVLPRIERRQERMLWKLTWEGAGKARPGPQPAGGTAGEKEDKITLKTLLGPKLTAEETARAKDRAPVDREGKLLCWGAISHLGCTQAGCQRSHEHLRGAFEALDPTVQMQLLRRGGLKRMRQETQESATAKIQELRGAVAKDKSSKIKEGQERRKAGDSQEGQTHKEGGKAGGVTWKAPVEMRYIDYTEQEQDFAELVGGPSTGTFEEVRKEAAGHAGQGGDTAPLEVKEMLRKAQQLADDRFFELYKKHQMIYTHGHLRGWPTNLR